MLKEIKHFLMHLRLHYQFFILSGGYLLGGLLADAMNTSQFWMQFLNVHVLLFGGATAYNSYWDKDEGPIGGLKHPPKMSRWMHPASLLMMAAGWVWSLQIGWHFFFIYGVSLLLFWLYSTPHARWKGDPLLSLVAIGVSTGTNSVLLGFWAAGGLFTWPILLSITGAAFILLSLYPVSQIYQFEEDQKRGDVTFFAKYGLKIVKSFFICSFAGGLVLVAAGFYSIYPYPAIFFFILGLCSLFILIGFISKLEGLKKEYKIVMKMKFFASLSFVFFIFISLFIRYEWIGSTFLTSYF